MTNLLHQKQTDRVPKQIVFGELTGTSPRHGTKRRWHNVIAGDLVSRDVSLGRCWRRMGAHGRISIVLRHQPLPWSRSSPDPAVERFVVVQT